jgi:predicted ATPase
VAEWARLPTVDRLPLSPLPAREIRELVRALHPGPISEDEIQRIVDRAEGNAFFTEELVAATEHGGAYESVPAELADLLLVRLDRLSAQARHVVQVTAVAGRRVTHGLLAAVADLPDGELDAALRDAIDEHILEPRGDDGYGFRHAHGLSPKTTSEAPRPSWPGTPASHTTCRSHSRRASVPVTRP